MNTTTIRSAALVALLGGTAAAQATEYGTVVSSTPVTASVPVSRQVCSDGQQVVQTAPSGAGAVIGAIAGGVIGHQIGNGFGRAAATGIGAVTGSVIGNQVEANATPLAEVPVRNCQTVTSYENRTVGYDVMYDYAGQRYSTRVPRDPGARMAIDVRPAAAATRADEAPLSGAESQPAGAPAPVYYAPVPAAGAVAQPIVYASPYYAEPYYAQPYYGAYIVPSISLGFGYYGGYRGGRHWR